MSDTSKALALVEAARWDYRPSGEDHIAVEECPICHGTNYKLYIHIGGEKDGLWDCKVCTAHGNIRSLQTMANVDNTTEAVSMKDMAATRTGPAPLPNFDKLHEDLLNDESLAPVLEHLTFDRKLTLDTLKYWNIGADKRNTKDGTEVCWFVVPYYFNTEPVFFKARSVNAKKMFRAPSGRPAQLFNADVIKSGMDELVLVEGEMDAITLWQAGFTNVVGVPGASNSKADWLELIDKAQPKTIYLLYDNDVPGQSGAKTMGTRIGAHNVRNIVLPKDKDGVPIKDISEYLNAGHTLEDFVKLKEAAKPFVEGVSSVYDALEELRYEIETKGAGPKYVTMWPSLNKRMGGYEPGDLIGLMAEGKIGKSTTALNWLQGHATMYGESVFMFCQEMLPKRVVRKWASYVTQTKDSPIASEFTSETINAALTVAKGMKGDILFGYSKCNEVKHVHDVIRQAHRRYGVKVVCFDNLQFLFRRIDNLAQEASVLSKGFKELAMELGIAIILVIQPHRVQEGHIVSSRNAYGSSAIEKDVDTMICLHRNRTAVIKQQDFHGFLDTDENFEPQMLVRVDLSRYAAGGVTTLFMDGERSTVREMSATDEATAAAQAPQPASASIPWDV